jgi:hypothetical protein
MEWRAIESAPRDGTHVLLLVDEYSIEGWWVVREDYYGNDRSAWQPATLDWHGCGCCQGSEPEPTHWMPLPKAP